MMPTPYATLKLGVDVGVGIAGKVSDLLIVITEMSRIDVAIDRSSEL